MDWIDCQIKKHGKIYTTRIHIDKFGLEKNLAVRIVPLNFIISVSLVREQISELSGHFQRTLTIKVRKRYEAFIKHYVFLEARRASENLDPQGSRIA